MVFGFHGYGIVVGLVGAVLQYVLAFAAVYVLAVITDALAPTFGGRKSQPNALKLAVYSMTPVWLVGVFSLIPGLRILAILGLYSVYLFWLGVPALMKAPDDKSVLYTAAVVVCGIVIYVVIRLVVQAFALA